MSTDEAQRSARETLSKIANELQTRRAELAHRLGLEGAAAASQQEMRPAAEGIAAATVEAQKPSVESLIQAAVKALGPRYEMPPKSPPAPAKPDVEKPVAPPVEASLDAVAAETAQPVANFEPQPVPEPPAAIAAPEQLLQASDLSDAVAKEGMKSSSGWPLPAAKNASATDLDNRPTQVEVTRPAPEAPADAAASVAIPQQPPLADRADAEPAPPAEPSRPFAPPPGAMRPGSKQKRKSSSFGSRLAGFFVRGLDDVRTRSVATTYFPMLIAVLALSAAIYQGYLFHAGLDVVQRNVARGDYLRACRDLIESYYTVKQRVGVLMPAADRSNVAGAARVTESNRIEAQAAVARFGALSTYLAAVQDPGTRARYAELMRTLTGNIDTARATPLADIDKMFEPADKLFAVMNDDCARLSRPVRM